MTALVPRGRFAACAAAAVVFGVGALSMRGEADIFRLSTSPTVDAVQTLGSRQRSAVVREVARVRNKELYAVPEPLLARLRGSTVHIDPWEAGVAWAYPDVVWRPAPNFQANTTYTEKLDRENVEFLDSSRAPRFVLRHRPEDLPDKRNPRFDPPTWNLRLLCRYRPLPPGGGWLLLERSQDRCSRAETIISKRARFQQTVRVPTAGSDDFVVASFGQIDEPVWQGLASILFKREAIHIRTFAGIYRFIQRTGTGLYLMRLPRCLEPGAIFDDRPYDTVALGRDKRKLATGGGAEQGEYTITFRRIRFRCPRGGTT